MNSKHKTIPMKTFKIVSLLLVFASILTLSSCNRKGCTDELAENYESKAKKDDGSCTFARTKFLGTYNCSRSCSYEPNATFSMTITEGPNNNEILISNFGDFNFSLKATVSGNNLTFKDNDPVATFEGTGYITNNDLQLNFEVCETFYYPCSDPDVCIVTGSK